MERSFSFYRRKVWITLSGPMIRSWISRSAPRSPRFWLPCSWSWSHVWDFDSLVMASLFDQGVPTKKTWTIFCFYGGPAGLCLLSLPVGCSQSVMALWCIGRFRFQTFVSHFQKVQTFSFEKHRSFYQVVSHSMMTDVTTCKMPIKCDPDLCTG